MSAILDRPLREGRRFQPSARASSSDALTPLERLEALCDPGSLQLIRTEVLSHAMGDKARQGDGVLGGSGTVGGRPVFCYAQDPRYAGGSLGEPHADTIARVLELAERGRAPVVGLRLLGRRPDAGGHRRARRLRADLPAHRRAVAARCRRSRSSPACRRAAARTRPRSPTGS